MLGKQQNYVNHSCLTCKDKSPEFKRRRIFKIVCFAKGTQQGKNEDEPEAFKVEYQDLLWEDCSWGKFGQCDDPDKRRRFTINHYILADRTSYHKTLKVYITAEDAIENIKPFRGVDPLSIHSRNTTWSWLIVMSGYFIFDIEYALPKNMYDLQVADGDPFNLPPLRDKRLALSLTLTEMRK